MPRRERSMRGALGAALALFTVLGIALPAGAAAATERPIVFAVVIDGLDGDFVDAGNAPFISSLIDGAGARTTYYRESRAVMVAETNPNHAAMMTGAYADRSGIAGNTFALYRDLAGEEDNEAETCEPAGPANKRALPTVTSGEHASCLTAETVFEAIARQPRRGRMTTAGIFGKAKLGRLFSAQRPNGSFYADHLWAPCTPDDAETEARYCADVPLEPVNNDRTIYDGMVMDEVIRVIREGIGPRGRVPDFTFVNLPNVDNAGHAFGGGGALYQLAITLADDEIERLVDELRAQGLWQRSVLVVLSDHSHDTTLRRMTLSASFEGAGVDPGRFLAVQNGGVDMIYLADRKAESRFALLKRMRAVALAQPGVDLALYREPNPLDGGRKNTVAARFPGWRSAGPRSGDLIIAANPGFSFSDPEPTTNPLIGNHGGWNTLDNTFLVAGGGPHVRHRVRSGVVGERFSDTRRNPKQAENVDLASTILGLLGLAETRQNRGRFLAEAFKRSALPGKTRPAVKPRVRARLRPGKRGPRTRRLEATWSPGSGVWQVQLRRDRHSWRTAYRRTRRSKLRVHVRRGHRYEVRVRAVSASGAKGRWGRSSTGA